MTHRHRFEVMRRERNTSRAMIRRCSVCGEVQRKQRGRWVVSIPGRARTTARSMEWGRS
jgi:hypothetical protein